MPILLLILVLVAIDQASKYYIQTHMTPGLSIPVINNVFHITYILNPGAAFGILQHRTWFFVVIAALLFAVVAYYYRRIPAGYRLLRLGLGLLLGGAAGNVIDRVQTGFVIDFFDFRIWPVFNIADMAICIGVALIVYTILLPQGKKDEAYDGREP